MKKTKKTPTRKPAKKPKSNRFFTPRCPECGHSAFAVFPQVVPELAVTFFDNGDVNAKLEDYSQDEGDQLCCANCGRETTWAECDHRRAQK